PVELIAGKAESIIAVLSTGTPTRKISCVGCDLVGDDSVLDVFLVWKSEVLFGSDVAKHGSAVPSDHRRTDRRGDMVIPRSDVGDQRAEGIERGLIAKLALFIYLLFNLIHWHVAGAFDHHLHIVFPSFFRELA